ncbi:sensor histidine kinase [Vibrio panuliri]|uniref:histidine kinase n=1 Tax=Vibrio panuliri TaxID=1381081 RepID=A0ABX3FUG6_9VIBR|nr:HAMP domain-containing sensor histidine kinase [Vibrio panuliri]KAB1453724.1 HAMP domain-containing histidine kinase [Vibrio panuliri]OLQ96451.1 two-component sensor histidine kinase [Vibrio panuliri]
MSFADNSALTRSSIFKTLVALSVLVTVLNIIIIRQLYIDSDNFHQQRLTAQLNDEVREFAFAAKQSSSEVEKLLKTKQATNTPFSYRIVEYIEPPQSTHYYPISHLTNLSTKFRISDSHQLEIDVDRQVLAAYKEALIPIVLTGVMLPSATLLVATFFFTVLILRRLETVNQAMNRVLCGERAVKLPVSRQDDEFDILSIHLNYMIEQMAKNETTLKSLTTGLAHDMRTPMARLKLRLEGILDDERSLNAEQSQQVSACHEELELLLSLFNSMLEIAKLNSGQTNITFQTVNLSKIAHDALEFVTPLAEQKQQQLIIRDDQPCLVSGDPSLLFRAIFNLIENAVKYTPEKGTIEIVIDKLGVVIADNGIGIADQDKLHVCQPMYRADKSRTEQGNGLGLSLVDAIAHRHGAQLLLKDNHPGLRARFYFN